MVQDLAEVEVEGSNLYIWEVIWGTGKGKGTLQGISPYPRGKGESSFSKVPWVGIWTCSLEGNTHSMDVNSVRHLGR